jgi:hypothetical protein
MTDFSSLYIRGAALIVASMVVQWFGSTYLASRMYSTPDEGRDFGSGFAVFGAVSSAWVALLAIGIGIILIACWHQVDSARNLRG